MKERPAIQALSEAQPEWLSPEPPPRVVLWTAGLLLALFAIGVFVVVFVPFPETIRCSFVLVPQNGSDPLQSPLLAIVQAVQVAEGQEVPQGAELFVLRSDEIRSWQTQLQIYQQDLQATQNRSRKLEEYYTAQLAIKDEELNQVEKEVGFREKHLATSRDFLARNEKLWAEKLISEVELLQHRLALAESEKDLNVAQRTVQQVTLQRRQLESERARQRTEEEAECEKLKVRLEAMQRQLENCHGALMSIHAPYHGVILSLAHRNAGGVVHEGDELCQLARVEGEPRVRLLVHEAGLPKLAVGQKVRLFFEAFPAQRYGTISGTLKWISPAAVTSGAGQQFTARAALAQTSFRARDGEHPLRVGMKGEARIVVGSRTLVEFALEPIRQLREQVRR